MASPSSAPSESKRKTRYYDDEDKVIDFGKYMLFLFPIGLFSGFVAWWRNSQSNIVMRIIYVFLAYVFNIFYLIYTVYRWWTYRPPPTQ
jgi:hypothetical protein